ncbi:MAG TPA: hypothetical protein VL221_02190 [Bacteroidota bacterium]|nr:hypothetical protein [Bacteroidota bacterium]
MSHTLMALRSLGPVIYGSTALVVLLLVFQTFGIDIVKQVDAIGQRLTLKNRVSRTGA